MPRRETKRGAERTRIDADADVLICGASFAGLAVARELAGSGARVLMIDRYEVGERQTSACAIPTPWLEAMGLMAAHRQTFGELLVHSARGDVRWRLPWTFSTFDYRTLCAALRDQGDAEFETATVERITRAPGAHTVHTDRGEVRAPLVVDALGWRRVLGGGPNVQPPDATLSRGLEVHPAGRGDELELWIDRAIVPAGYGWSFPAGDEVRVGVGSFDPRFHVKAPTVRLAEAERRDPVRFQGNWIPHRIRPATEGGVFFAGDSAGHCLPTTAEGIRTALYFGLACGREVRAVVDGRSDRAGALARYGDFSAGHRWKFEWLLRVQRLVPRLAGRPLRPTLRAVGVPAVTRRAFDHYLEIAHPRFVGARAAAALPSPPRRNRVPA